MNLNITNQMVGRFLLESFDPTALPYKTPSPAEYIIAFTALEDIMTMACKPVIDKVVHLHDREGSIAEWRSQRTDRRERRERGA